MTEIFYWTKICPEFLRNMFVGVVNISKLKGSQLSDMSYDENSRLKS